jgi:hypothetical protein
VAEAKREALYYTHEFLWSDLDDVFGLLRTRNETPRGLFTAALVLTYSCFEAHLNFIGETLFPEAWSQERRTFSVPPYRGTLGKLAFLANKLGVAIDRGRKPIRLCVT